MKFKLGYIFTLTCFGLVSLETNQTKSCNTLLHSPQYHYLQEHYSNWVDVSLSQEKNPQLVILLCFNHTTSAICGCMFQVFPTSQK